MFLPVKPSLSQSEVKVAYVHVCKISLGAFILIHPILTWLTKYKRNTDFRR